ncbi:MAG: 30S ribosomal protein S16 [Alphaproteobacteria bacterium]|jgi:small subunit ribosomal protein S16|nr:30S ribosomal protein S16 [Alphaproteobacteria bacterium]
MSTVIRLARGGAKKRPFYSIVVADSRTPRDGRFIEKIGFYNPMVARDAENRVVIKDERAKHWLSTGARPSDRVAKFFTEAGLMEARGYRETPKKSAPKAKAQERLKQQREAAAAAAAAAAGGES